MVSVSVILPVYNAEEYIYDSIQSILNQSVNSFEILIINDGSTDKTEEIIQTFNDTRIRYFKNEKNIKLIDTLNLGLQLATGKYIARIDADDIALPNRFEKQVEFLEHNPDYGLVGCYTQQFGDSNDVVKYVVEDEDIRYAFLTHNPFVHSSVMFRSSLIKKYNFQYDKRWLHVEDYDLWIRLLQVTKGKNLSEILVNYRVHNSQISFKFRELQLKNTRKLQKEYLQLCFSNINSIDLIISLLNGDRRPVSDLVTFIKGFSINHFYNKFEERVMSSVLKVAKNQLLESHKVSFREQCHILSILRFFTFKQKVALLIKLF